MKIKLVLASMVLMPSVAIGYDGWSTGQIDKIRYQDHRTLINQVGATNPGNCDTPNYILLKEDGSDFAKRQNSALLAAQMSGKSVSLALKGCSQGGTEGYPVISEVWITNN